MIDTLLSSLKYSYTHQLYHISSRCPRPLFLGYFYVIAAPMITFLLTIQTTQTLIDLDSHLQPFQISHIDSLSETISSPLLTLNCTLLLILIFSVFSALAASNFQSTSATTKNPSQKSTLYSTRSLQVVFSACIKLYPYTIAPLAIYFASKHASTSSIGIVNVILTYILGTISIDCEFDYTINSHDSLSRSFDYITQLAFSLRCLGITIIALTSQFEIIICIIVCVVESAALLVTPFHQSSIQISALSSNIFITSLTITLAIFQINLYHQASILFAFILMPLCIAITSVFQRFLTNHILATPIDKLTLPEIDAYMRFSFLSLHETSPSIDFIQSFALLNSQHESVANISSQFSEIAPNPDVRSPIFIHSLRDSLKTVLKYRFEDLNRSKANSSRSRSLQNSRIFSDPRYLVFILQAFKSPRLYWLLYETSCKHNPSWKYQQILNSIHVALFDTMVIQRTNSSIEQSIATSNSPTSSLLSPQFSSSSSFDQIYSNLIAFEDRVSQILQDFSHILDLKLRVLDIMRQRTIDSLDFMQRLDAFMHLREILRNNISILISTATTPLSNSILSFFEREILLRRDSQMRNQKRLHPTSVASKAKTIAGGIFAGASVRPPNQIITTKSCVVLSELQPDRTLLINKLSRNAISLFSADLKDKPIESLMPTFYQKYHQSFIDNYLNSHIDSPSKLSDQILFIATQTSIYIKPVRIDVRVNEFSNAFGIAALITPIHQHNRQTNNTSILSSPSYILYDVSQRSVIGISKKIHRELFPDSENPAKIDLPSFLPLSNPDIFNAISFSYLIITDQPHNISTRQQSQQLNQQQQSMMTQRKLDASTNKSVDKSRNLRSIISRAQQKRNNATLTAFSLVSAADRTAVQIDEHLMFTIATISISQLQSTSASHITSIEFMQLQRVTFQHDFPKIIALIKEQNHPSLCFLLPELEFFLHSKHSNYPQNLTSLRGFQSERYSQQAISIPQSSKRQQSSDATDNSNDNNDDDNENKDNYIDHPQHKREKEENEYRVKLYEPDQLQQQQLDQFNKETMILSSPNRNTAGNSQLIFSMSGGVGESSKPFLQPDSFHGTANQFFMPLQSPTAQDILFSPVSPKSMRSALLSSAVEILSNRNEAPIPAKEQTEVQETQEFKDIILLRDASVSSGFKLNQVMLDLSVEKNRTLKTINLDRSSLRNKNISTVFQPTTALASSMVSLQSNVVSFQNTLQNKRSSTSNKESQQQQRQHQRPTRKNSKEDTSSAKNRSSIASADRELKVLGSTTYYTRPEVKVLGLIGACFVATLIGVITFEFNSLTTQMNSILTSQEVGSWPADYLASTNSVIKNNNILLWMKYDTFPNASALQARVNSNGQMLRDMAIQYINQSVTSDSDVLLFQLVREKKSSIMIGVYYDVNNLSSVSSVPAKYTFYYTLYETSLMYSTVLSYMHIYRYSKGLGVDRPEYYMILNNLNFIVDLDELQEDILVSQKSEDDSRKRRILVETFVFISISMVLVFAMIPLEIYQKKAKEVILTLFGTFSVEKIDDFVDDVARARDNFQDIAGDVFIAQKQHQKQLKTMTTTNANASSNIKRGISSNKQQQQQQHTKNVYSVTTRLKKVQPLFVAKLVLVLGILIIYPIVNYVVSTNYIDYSFVSLRTLVNMYKVKGYIVELIALSYTNMVLKLHPASKPVIVTQYMSTILSLLNQKEEMYDKIKTIIKEQGVVSRYEEQLYDDFFFNVLKSNMCSAFQSYPNLVSNSTLINNADCIALNDGFLTKGFQLAFLEFVSLSQRMYDITTFASSSTEFTTASTEFLASFDLNDFTLYQEFLTEVLVTLKNFILSTSRAYHNTMLIYQTIILVIQIILLLVAFFFGYLKYVQHVFLDIERTKRYLSIIDVQSLRNNTYILSYIQRTRHRHE